MIRFSSLSKVVDSSHCGFGLTDSKDNWKDNKGIHVNFKTKSLSETDKPILKSCLIQTNTLKGDSINISKNIYITPVEAKKDMHTFIQGNLCCI